MSKDDTPSIRRSVERLPLRKPKAPEHVPLEHDDGDLKDKVRQTLHLPVAVHDQLRQLSFHHRVSQQELFRRALNLLFEQMKAKSWDELVPPKPKG
jgi:hypothetical protein